MALSVGGHSIAEPSSTVRIDAAGACDCASFADLGLAHALAQDGYGELWIALYYGAVRLGGWWAWHFAACDTAARARGPTRQELE